MGTHYNFWRRIAGNFANILRWPVVHVYQNTVKQPLKP
jgi:hypothetical protein